eukprot:m.143742 g.143742  ORF g.143742 m.143742 type:complete len:512 (-) comp14104_c1_seq1:125-1660(-)
MSMSTTYQDAPFIHADCPTIALPPLPSTNMQPQEAYHSQDWWRQQQSSDEAGSVCTSTCRSSRISSSCSSSGRNSTSTDVSVLDLSLDLSSNYDGGLSAGFDFSPDCLDLDLDLGVGSASCCNSRLSLGVQSTLCSPVFSKNQNSRPEVFWLQDGTTCSDSGLTMNLLEEVSSHGCAAQRQLSTSKVDPLTKSSCATKVKDCQPLSLHTEEWRRNTHSWQKILDICTNSLSQQQCHAFPNPDCDLDLDLDLDLGDFGLGDLGLSLGLDTNFVCEDSADIKPSSSSRTRLMQKLDVKIKPEVHPVLNNSLDVKPKIEAILPGDGAKLECKPVLNFQSFFASESFGSSSRNQVKRESLFDVKHDVKPEIDSLTSEAGTVSTRRCGKKGSRTASPTLDHGYIPRVKLCLPPCEEAAVKALGGEHRLMAMKPKAVRTWCRKKGLDADAVAQYRAACLNRQCQLRARQRKLRIHAQREQVVHEQRQTLTNKRKGISLLKARINALRALQSRLVAQQ